MAAQKLGISTLSTIIENAVCGGLMQHGSGIIRIRFVPAPPRR